MFLPEQLNADTLKDANREHGYVSMPPNRSRKVQFREIRVGNRESYSGHSIVICVNQAKFIGTAKCWVL
ncbi:MAG: hypothetical protein NPIRA04_19130 [Nitrospirales bacterium]|nr:MAG: hypothetical protein NPIRA04_19130 [Nitrospirales bacterium]